MQGILNALKCRSKLVICSCHQMSCRDLIGGLSILSHLAWDQNGPTASLKVHAIGHGRLKSVHGCSAFGYLGLEVTVSAANPHRASCFDLPVVPVAWE